MGVDDRKRILWITNMMPGFVARQLGKKATNKEGWIEGAASRLLLDKTIALAIAFPGAKDEILLKNEEYSFYSFQEDWNHPENYDANLETAVSKVIEDYKPDIIHIFGTEFPHTLAVMKNAEYRDKTLIHIQGIMEECRKVYTAGIPEKVVNRATFRDVIKKDSIKDQLYKYSKRAENEHKALKYAKNVCGRTDFDKKHIEKLNPECRYFKVNESLRASFYENNWELDKCNRHEIFVSQGNYPLKGIHTALNALSLIKARYPDLKLYVAGDKITAYETIKDKLKISSYGKYLNELITKYGLKENVIFTGALTEEEMLARYKSAEVYLLTSFVENSPNSLGEAMLLGMPTIATDVGGVTSMVLDGKESLLYKAGDATLLSQKLITIFEDDKLKKELAKNAKVRAMETHNKENNYNMLLEAYRNI